MYLSRIFMLLFEIKGFKIIKSISLKDYITRRYEWKINECMVCKFHSLVNGIFMSLRPEETFFFYPEHQIHQQSLLILLLQYLINLPTSFTKIIVVHITIIFVWTSEIAIKPIFLHTFSLSSNQFFCSVVIELFKWQALQCYLLV